MSAFAYIAVSAFALLPSPIPADPTYHEQYALDLLAQLDAPATSNAIAVVVAWQHNENCGGHNKLCLLKPDRTPYTYTSRQRSAAVTAQQLDPHHPDRPDHWRNAYPHLTSAMRHSWRYASASALVAAISADLDRWCGKPAVCGHAHYVSRIATRAQDYQDQHLHLTRHRTEW